MQLYFHLLTIYIFLSYFDEIVDQGVVKTPTFFYMAFFPQGLTERNLLQHGVGLKPTYAMYVDDQHSVCKHIYSYAST